jgi:hypothetical protein
MAQRADWWNDDPTTLRNGIGVILHMTEAHWRIHKTMKGSPAAQSGFAQGDRVVSIDGYQLLNGDIAEAFMVARQQPRNDGNEEWKIVRGDQEITKLVKSVALRDLISGHLQGGGISADFCYSCYGCMTVATGWVNCGAGGCDTQCTTG